MNHSIINVLDANKAYILKSCLEFFIPNEQAIALENLPKVVAILSEISNSDLSSLTNYIMKSK